VSEEDPGRIIQSWQTSISRVRAELAVSLVEELGVALAEVVVDLRVSTSAVSKILLRQKR
jgi:hypothetical protein